MPQATFLSKLLARYGDKFDFSQAVYAGSHAKTTIICPEHGPFQSSPNKLLHPNTKHACPKCAREASKAKISKTKTKTKETFIREAVEVHSDAYDYSKVVYLGTTKEVEIVCKKHGSFWQQPRVHLSGSGCTQCFRERKIIESRLTKEGFAQRGRNKHGDKFDYSETDYNGYGEVVKIRCKKHDKVFAVNPASHLAEYKEYNNLGGCPECAKETNQILQPIPEEEFLKRANTQYGTEFTYSGYCGIMKPVTIHCKTHGAVNQLAYVHLRGSGCPICNYEKYTVSSKEEEQLYEFIKELDPDARHGDRSLIRPKELDIVSYAHKVAIEYCGLYWHSSAIEGNHRMKHLQKHNLVSEEGFRLITLFSDEWMNKQEQVKLLLRRALGHRPGQLIGGRECQVVSISSEEASDFHNLHHIGGSRPGRHLGLMYKDSLISVMTLGQRPIYGTKACHELEIVRYSVDPNWVIAGGLAKLCSSIRPYDGFTTLVTYVDKRLFTGKSYIEAGFKVIRETKPGYWYTKGQKRISRFSLAKCKQKDVLKQFNPNLSEIQNAENNGWFRIYDCGQIRLERGLT